MVTSLCMYLDKMSIKTNICKHRTWLHERGLRVVDSTDTAPQHKQTGPFGRKVKSDTNIDSD